MARQQKNGFSKFDINSSEAMRNIEDIYDSESSSEQSASKDVPAAEQPALPETAPAAEPQPAETIVPETQEQVQTPVAPKRVIPLNMKPLKADKGVKIQLPMDYYFKLVQIKACTGKSLQDLAAQAVMEFIDDFFKGKKVEE
jgi:hypothetical protein